MCSCRQTVQKRPRPRLHQLQPNSLLLPPGHFVTFGCFREKYTVMIQVWSERSPRDSKRIVVIILSDGSALLLYDSIQGQVNKWEAEKCWLIGGVAVPRCMKTANCKCQSPKDQESWCTFFKIPNSVLLRLTSGRLVDWRRICRHQNCLEEE